MSDTDDRFERERERAIEELQRDDVLSFYLGMVLDEDGTQAIEYRLRTDSDDPRTRQGANLIQLAMMLSAMADEADASLEAVAEAGVERAKAGDFQRQV